MKRIIIAALLVLALGITGCSVGTGSDGIEANPGVQLPDDDPTNPFEIEPPADEDEDEVPVAPEGEDDPADEEDDPAQPIDEDETIFQMRTEADDVLTDAVVGTYYEQTFNMFDKNVDYSWSVSGLPEGSGLSLTEQTESWRYKLEGTPVIADIGTRQITVTVVDANDSERSAQLSFELTVDGGMGELQANTDHVDTCSLPLRIVVDGFGGNVDPAVLRAGKFRAKIDSDVNIRFKAIRSGLVPHHGSRVSSVETREAVGEVVWSFTSRVKDGHHCRELPKDDDWGSNYDGPSENNHEEEEDYIYTWTVPNANSCSSLGGGPGNYEYRITRNPTWQAMRSLPNANGNPSGVLGLTGHTLYDGPLPVYDLPHNQDAVEVIEVTATDGCSAGGANEEVAHRQVEIGIKYPTADEDGGNLSDLKVKLKYGRIDDYYGSHKTSNPYSHPSNQEIENCDQDSMQCVSRLVIGFAGDAITDTAKNEFLSGVASNEEDMPIDTALNQLKGYSTYSILHCDKGLESGCPKNNEIVDVQSSDITSVRRMYLFWNDVSLNQLDFDIEKIKIYNRYYKAVYNDERDFDGVEGNENYFDKNVVKDHRALHNLTQRHVFEGMEEANPDGSLFHRQELAGYIGYYAE